MPALLYLVLVGSISVNLALAIFLWYENRGQQRQRLELKSRADRTGIDEFRLVQALEGADLGFWDWDLTSDRIILNSRGLNMLGYRANEIGCGKKEWLTLVHPDDLDTQQRCLHNYLKTDAERYECEYRVRHKQGHWIWILDRGRLLELPGRAFDKQMVGTFLDISQRKAMELQLQEFANTDALTRLSNRRVFLERLHQELARIDRQPDSNAFIVMCDVDHFKCINDRFGHDVGDLALRHVADILSNNVRANDLAARWGGEEFCVILQNTTLTEAYSWAERVRATLEKFPVSAPGGLVFVTVSFGLSSLSADEQGVESSLKRADQALYQAKNAGRNQVVIGN